MKPTEEEIKRVIKLLQNKKVTAEEEKDEIKARLCYIMSESLRWSILNTDWDSPDKDIDLYTRAIKEEFKDSFKPHYANGGQDES